MPEIKMVALDDPSVAALLADVMAELSARYGGSGDDTPVSAADFIPPAGAFFVAVQPSSTAAAPAAAGLSAAGGSGSGVGGDSGPGAGGGSGSGADEGGRLIGCAGWRRHGSDAELKRMFTTKAARGQGIATRLLATIEESARSAGCTRVILETGDKQPEAVALYEKLGYARIPDFGFYAGYDGVLSYAKPL